MGTLSARASPGRGHIRTRVWTGMNGDAPSAVYREARNLRLGLSFLSGRREADTAIRREAQCQCGRNNAADPKAIWQAAGIRRASCRPGTWASRTAPTLQCVPPSLMRPR